MESNSINRHRGNEKKTTVGRKKFDTISSKREEVQLEIHFVCLSAAILESRKASGVLHRTPLVFTFERAIETKSEQLSNK